jgi:hypothetical protein
LRTARDPQRLRNIVLMGMGEPLHNYAAPAAPRVWLDTLGAALGLFLADKTLLPKEILPPLAPLWPALAPHAAVHASAALAWLTSQHRARALGLAPTAAETALSAHPIVAEAQAILA